MGDKQSKSLALELMDDLLSDEEAQSFERDVVGATLAVENDSGLVEVTEQPTVDPEEPSVTLNLSLDEEDKTVRVGHSDKTAISHSSAAVSYADSKRAPAREDRERASVGRFASLRSTVSANATEASLAQSENLRIAQNRLLEFENEIERLRSQNEELAAAAETLRRRTDELSSLNQKRESDYQNAVSTFEQERSILIGAKEGVQRELETLRQRTEELELRISSNIQKIRVRERELENRLELLKMESAALIRSKDEMILELKRNMDQLNLELTNYRNKNQELNRITMDKQEQLRRTVKALRLALSMLEGEEEPVPASTPPLRKAK